MEGKVRIFIFVLLEPKSTLHITGTQNTPAELNLNLGYLSTQHTFTKNFHSQKNYLGILEKFSLYQECVHFHQALDSRLIVLFPSLVSSTLEQV